MSLTNRNPLRLAGAVLNSGNVQTGEQNFTLGGGQAASIYSGILDANLSGALKAAYGAVASGADVLLFSGGGRLKDVFLHQSVLSLSGVAFTFYDAGTVVSGGPFYSSGHKIIGVVPGNWGVSGQIMGAGQVAAFDVPFQSGLCVQTKSGVTGFTVTYTPEPNPAPTFVA